jgi:hypothetical protein
MLPRRPKKGSCTPRFIESLAYPFLVAPSRRRKLHCCRRCGLLIVWGLGPRQKLSLAKELTGGIAVRARIPEATTNPTTQCTSNPVSGRGLPKTGIFQIFARDYRRFIPGSGQIWSPETNDQLAKARCRRAFLRLPRTASLSAVLPGWGGRIRTSVWWNQNPLPYHLATPQRPGRTGVRLQQIHPATPVYRGS